MIDVILDTNILGDFLAQYYELDVSRNNYGRFRSQGRISEEIARKMNAIIESYRVSQDPSYSGLVITSVLAFIELGRKFDEIAENRFEPIKIYDFVNTHPDWFSITPIDMDLIPFFIDVPKYVEVNSKMVPMEWTDSIHVATALSRGGKSLIATLDAKIKAITTLKHRVIS